MSKRDKQIDKLRRNPKNIRFQDIDTLLLGLGFRRRQRGSHHVYSLGRYRITVPHRKPFIKPVYVKLLLEILEELEQERPDD